MTDEVALAIAHMRIQMTSMQETILACQEKHPTSARYWQDVIRSYQAAIEVLESA